MISDFSNEFNALCRSIVDRLNVNNILIKFPTGQMNILY